MDSISTLFCFISYLLSPHSIILFFKEGKPKSKPALCVQEEKNDLRGTSGEHGIQPYVNKEAYLGCAFYPCPSHFIKSKDVYNPTRRQRLIIYNLCM